MTVFGSVVFRPKEQKMSKPVSRLGRGLTSLIATRTEVQSEQPSQTAETIARLSLDSIVPNPHQPRTTFSEASLAGLAESIRTNGVVQPIVVRKTERGYELVAGERRLRAARMAGLKTIPAIVRQLSDRDALELALIENLQREDLTPLERAKAYQNYLDTFGGTIDDLADRLSESRSNISNYLRLLTLSPDVCYLLGKGELSMGQARALATVEDHRQQAALAKIVVRRNLSVRQVENLVRQATYAASGDGAPVTLHSTATRRHYDEVSQAMSRALGLPVRIVPSRRKNSGRVLIAFRSLDEFEIIAQRLGASVQLD